MPDKWLKLAGEMLELASDQFSNHGCNDWRWPDDWTQKEREGLAKAMTVQNFGRPMTQEEEQDAVDIAKCEFGPPDWWVMDFLGQKLGETDA